METWDGGRWEWEDASASGSGGGDTPPHEDWPWPWGALGLNPFLTLALSLLSMLSEGLCARPTRPTPPQRNATPVLL